MAGRLEVDPRWRAAVEASAAWYDDVFALHAIPTEAGDGLWRSLGPPPRWHSAVKTLEPGVPVERVLDAMAPHPRGGIADSFGDLPLDGLAFDLLIDATWLHRPADVDPPTTLPAGWSVVTGPDELARWNDAHDTTGVLLPALLRHPRFTVLAHHGPDGSVGGAVLHDTPGAVGLSNAWSSGSSGSPGSSGSSGSLPWGGLLATASALHPGRDLTDYAWGADLDDALAAGFVAVGRQRVWLPS